MALQDELRAQLIKQFAADVLIVTDKDGMESYVCPTCKKQPHYPLRFREIFQKQIVENVPFLT